MNIELDRLADTLCWRDKRSVSEQLKFIYERKRLMLEKTELARGLVGEHIDTYAFPDGRFEAKWKGLSLPYSVFDRDQQHVTHAAVTEHKRLSEVLSEVKKQQDGPPAPAPKVKIDSEKVGYKSTAISVADPRRAGSKRLSARQSLKRCTRKRPQGGLTMRPSPKQTFIAGRQKRRSVGRSHR